MKPRASARRCRSLWPRLGVSGLLLGILFTRIDLTRSFEIVIESRIDLVVLLFCLLTLERVLAVVRWYILIRWKSAAIRFGSVFRLVLAGNVIGLFLPGGAGTDVVRVIGLAKSTSDAALSFSSVLVERLLAITALMLLVLVGASLSPPGLPAGISRLAWVGMAALAIGAVTLMHPSLRILTQRVLPGRKLRSLRRGLSHLYAALDEYRIRPRILGGSALLAIAFQMLRIVEGWVGARALGIDVPVLDFVVILPIIIFVTLIPISISGLGVREAGFVYLFGLVGVSVEAALTLSLLHFTLGLASLLPMALLGMLPRMKKRSRDTPPKGRPRDL